MKNRVQIAYEIITYILNVNDYKYDNLNWALDGELWFKKDDFIAHISIDKRHIEFVANDLSIMPKWLNNWGNVQYGNEFAMFELWI